VAKYVLRKVKNVGKPYAGKPHVRFDEEGLASQPFTLQMLEDMRNSTNRGTTFRYSRMDDLKPNESPRMLIQQHPWALILVRTYLRITRKASAAASIVTWISSSVCAVVRNQASYFEGARLMPRSSISRKNCANCSPSVSCASA